MVIDTHTHLYLEEFGEDGGIQAVDRAVEAGVEHMIFPNVDLTTIAPMKKLYEARPEVTSMAMGFHPTEVNEQWRDSLATITEEITANGRLYKAIGEIGIDLYWDKTYAEQQMQAFELQCQLAVDHNLPIIIHCREGLPNTLEVLSQFPQLRGVMHSFGGTTRDVEMVLNTNENMLFGINGIVTFKNCQVRDSLEAITLDRLLLETDSPYLAPVPFRGKRCESAYIIHTLNHIAHHLGRPVEEIAAITTRNARTLFNICSPTDRLSVNKY